MKVLLMLKTNILLYIPLHYVVHSAEVKNESNSKEFWSNTSHLEHLQKSCKQQHS